jgi:hypothetical protein
MFERCYSPSRAREALRFVRPAAERIRALYHRLERRRPRSVIPEQRVEAAYFIVLRDLQSIVDRLAAEGVRVKDPKQGLIDFPARRAGRRVWLCWKLGESSVRHWHELDAGYAGRRPIDDGGPWDEAADKAEIAG